MGKLKRIGLIIFVSFVSLYILFIFILINFPYKSLVKRFDFYLEQNYSVKFSIEEVHYRFPFKFLLKDVKLTGSKSPFSVEIGEIGIRINPLTSQRSDTLALKGEHLKLKSDYLQISKGNLTILSRLRIGKLLGDGLEKAIILFSLFLDDVEVDKFIYSGLEFSSFQVSKANITIRNTEQKFVIQRGLFTSDLLTAEATGGFDLNSVDISSSLKLSREFYKKYIHLKGIIDSVSDGNDNVRIRIKGDILKPEIILESKK